MERNRNGMEMAWRGKAWKLHDNGNGMQWHGMIRHGNGMEMAWHGMA
jgi:hypothetical protein